MTDNDSAVRVLRSLSPKYTEKDHAEYVQILVTELRRTGADAPHNVALTGHYGSGKSSVLVEVQKRLSKANLKVINLSLPSLGVGDGRLPKDGDKALDKTNLIQKEIVKQLLYRRKPSDTPASRYNRLDAFNDARAYRLAVLMGIVFACVALLAKLPTKVEGALPKTTWTWLDKHVWPHTAISVQWLSLLVVFILAGLTAMWVQRLLQRIRVAEFGAGSAKVSLSEGSSSFFDEYLDEIVYFFQISKTEVVIFEDLDRFKDPHIFEALRELNLLLNNADQTGNQPIRFVYAIRDSIFEQLDAADDTKQARDVIADEPAVIQSDEAEHRRLKSTNRTKFFDLVVPIVPFITHRTSREWIRDELKFVDEVQKPTSQVIDIVGTHLTDMRLIKNICNEFDIFRSRILAVDGLTELTADRLFASVVYKNLYLADYEDIRTGRSRLDTFYRAYRDWVANQVACARADERKARLALRGLNSVAKRSERLGARLEEVLHLTYGGVAQSKTLRVSAAGVPQAWVDLRGADFWSSYLKEQPDVTVKYTSSRPHSYGVSAELTFSAVQSLLGETLDAGLWTENDRTTLGDKVADAVAAQRSMTHASMAAALAEDDRTFIFEGEDSNLASVAEELFEGEDVVLDLLRSGLIDENFTLYTTQFPGQGSASAMNFVMKSVQPSMADFDYHFGAGEAVDDEDIRAVVRTEGARLFAGRSIYNRELFDYLLKLEPGQLNGPIQRLSAASESDLAFIDAYVSSGREVATFLRLLAAEWTGIFDHLLGEQPESADSEHLDAALRGVDPQVPYKLSDDQRKALVAAMPSLKHITTRQTAQRAKSIADVLNRLGVEIPDLTVVESPLRDEVVKRKIFRVTLANLRLLVSGELGASLDGIKAEREGDVYPHVMSRLRQYLTALEDAPDVPTVVSLDEFTSVLGDVYETDPDLLAEVARRAKPECMVRELADLPVASWPAVVAAQRLALSSHNVSAYIAERGVDVELAQWLTTAGHIDRSQDDDLVQLALSLLNSEALADATKLQLVSSLQLDAGALDPSDLAAAAHTALGGLVAIAAVADDEHAYGCLGVDEWAAKKSLISSSEEFQNYMFRASLGPRDLQVIGTYAVPDTVRQALLTNVERFDGTLGARGAKGLAEWAVTKGLKPSPAGLVTMAKAAGSPASSSILTLLGGQANALDVESMRTSLDALGGPYNQLTQPGRDRPNIPIEGGVEPILRRLQSEGIVSKYYVNDKKQVYKVSKRHS